MKENLRRYLESLFINAPQTPGNDALFEELLGNLCDRYDELTATGLAPDAAYARVIGEVGDIRPLLEGVAPNGTAADYTPRGGYNAPQGSTPPPSYTPPQQGKQKARLTPEALRRAKQRKGIATAVAVMLYILWLVPTIMWDAVAPLFICAAIGTVILVLANTQLPDYADDSRVTYNEKTRQNDTRIANILQATGIGLLILSVLPAALINTSWGAALMFLFVAVGVGMLIYAAFTRPALDKKLKALGMAAPAAPSCTQTMPHGEYEAQSTKKRNRLILPVVLISVIAVITVGILLAIHYDFQFGFYVHGTDVLKYTNHGSATMDTAVDRISVSWESGHVTVEPYDGETVEIYETQSGNAIAEVDDEMHWYLENGHLHIRFDGKGYFRFSFGRRPEKQLIVRVPRDSALLTSLALDVVSANLTVKDVGATGAFSISNVSGSIVLQNVSAAPFRLDTVSGTLSLTNGQFSNVRINTVSGNITLVNVSATKAALDSVSGELLLTDCNFQGIDANTTSGDLRITPAGTLDSLNFDTTSGDLTLTLPADHTGFSAELDSTGGEFASDFATTVSNDTHRYGDGHLNIEMDSTSGNLNIRRTE